MIESTTFKIKFLYDIFDSMQNFASREHNINGFKNLTLKEAYNFFLDETQIAIKCINTKADFKGREFKMSYIIDTQITGPEKSIDINYKFENEGQYVINITVPFLEKRK